MVHNWVRIVHVAHLGSQSSSRPARLRQQSSTVCGWEFAVIRRSVLLSLSSTNAIFFEDAFTILQRAQRSQRANFAPQTCPHTAWTGTAAYPTSTDPTSRKEHYVVAFEMRLKPLGPTGTKCNVPKVRMRPPSLQISVGTIMAATSLDIHNDAFLHLATPKTNLVNCSSSLFTLSQVSAPT